MTIFTELQPWLRLFQTAGVGNAASRKLLAAFGSPRAIFEQSAQALRQVVSAAQVAALQAEPENFAETCYLSQAWLAESPSTRTVLTLEDERYPKALFELADPPLLLFIEGTLAHVFNFEAMRAVAMVGSRNPTTQGVHNAHAFAKALAEGGLCVVSGLALGIDASAHEGAISSGDKNQSNACKTMAVLGSGLDRIYPKQHSELATKIAKNGLLISEFPLGTPPVASNFPKRNRIIAALSEGTLVIEATLQSGSLITARLASEIGKDVYAIPGSIHAPQAKGCHALIKQGAKLVESAADVFDELPMGVLGEINRKTVPAFKTIATNQLDTMPHVIDEASPKYKLLTALGFDPCGLDALLARLDCDAATLQVQLLELELTGMIARLPGGLYQRLGKMVK